MGLCMRKEVAILRQERAAILAGSSDAIIGKTPDGAITYWNPGAERLYGFRAEEAIGEHISIIVPPDNTTELSHILTRLKRGERIEITHTRRRRKDGSTVLVAVKISPILDTVGNIVGASSIAREIAPRPEQLPDPEGQTALSHAVLDSLLVHVVVLNCEGDIVATNAGWRRFASENGLDGYTLAPRTGIGTNYLEVCRAAGAVEALTGILAVLHGEQESFTLEYPCDSPEEQRWFQMSVTPLGTPSQGVVISHQDITARHNAEDALRESEARLARVQALVHLGSIEKDCDTGHIYWSDENFRLLGYEPGAFEPSAERFLDHVHPDDRDRMSESMRQFRSGVASSVEYRVLRADGAVRWFHTDAEMDDTRGSRGKLIATSRDITEQKEVQEALERQEVLFRDTFEQAAVGIAHVALDGHFLRVNQRFSEMFGYSRDEMGAKTLEDITYPDDLTPELYRQVREGEIRTFSREKRYLSKNGTLVWGNLTVSMTRTPGGQPDFFISVFEDITRRKEVEAERSRAEKERGYVLESARCLLWSAEVHEADGKLIWRQVYFDEEAAQRLAPIEAESGDDYLWKWHSVRFAEDRERNYRQADKWVRAGQNYNDEFRMRAADGSVHWLHEDVRVQTVEPGKRWHLVGVCTDITERKRAQEVQEHVTRSARCLIWHGEVVGDPEKPEELDWRLRSLSDELAEGFLPLAIRDDSNYLLAMTENRLEEDSQKIYQPSLNALLANRNYNQEFRVRDKHGKVWWIHEDVSVERVSPGKWRLVGVCTDVTARKQAEAAQVRSQKLEALGTLAGGVAHDFNNLLTIINTNSEIICSEPDADSLSQELAREICQAGERAASLTRQLLAFSRSQILEPKILNLNRIVTDTERMLRRLIGEDILISVVLEPTLGQVRADPGQMEQILLNLAVNARDAMPQGGNLTIETANVELDESYTIADPDVKPGSYVSIAMTDTGIGMDEATKARIFEPFFTTKGLGKGTGLGMATVFGIVKQSGGQIIVYSEVGHGTTFRIYLPRTDAVVRNEATRSRHHSATTGTETILLAEDESALRSITRRILERQGYTVLEAEDGGTALRTASEHEGTIHLLISDVVMPRMSGRQLAEQLTNIRPGIKVLYLSGYTDDAVIRHGVLQAETAFLQKPYTLVGLAEKVRTVLDQ